MWELAAVLSLVVAMGASEAQEAQEARREASPGSSWGRLGRNVRLGVMALGVVIGEGDDGDVERGGWGGRWEGKRWAGQGRARR